MPSGGRLLPHSAATATAHEGFVDVRILAADSSCPVHPIAVRCRVKVSATHYQPSADRRTVLVFVFVLVVPSNAVQPRALQLEAFPPDSDSNLPLTAILSAGSGLHRWSEGAYMLYATDNSD